MPPTLAFNEVNNSFIKLSQFSRQQIAERMNYLFLLAKQDELTIHDNTPRLLDHATYLAQLKTKD